MTKPQVLVVEDDAAIRRGIVDALAYEGYRTLEASSCADGLDKAIHSTYDLMLLDLVLPGGDGLDILERLRTVRPTLPVIILTARGEESDRVRGLRLGADDYVVKPFSVKELLARVQAVLRRSPERPGQVLRVKIPAGLVDIPRSEVRFDDGARAKLSQSETRLLEYLLANPGRAISREEILTRVWRMNPRGVETRTIDMHIVRLREKLRDDPDRPAVILTVRGKGYMFASPGETS
jgi:DNA-binding response OmpR family regulator